MKLRTKAIIFWATFLAVVALVFSYYLRYVVSDTFRNQAISDMRIFADQSEGAYYAFLRGPKTRVVDWSSDTSVSSIASEILASKKGTPERDRLVKKFADYITEKKMPYDKTVLLVDILDENEVIIASTNPSRVNTSDAHVEPTKIGRNFSEIMSLKRGEAFVGGVSFEDDEASEPIMRAGTHLYLPNEKGEPTPLNAILSIHFLNTNQIQDLLWGRLQVEDGARSGDAFLSNYKTSEVYLVNRDNQLVTQTRYIKDIKSKYTIDSLPVTECLVKGREVVVEYLDYRGANVLGAGMCLESEGLVLVVEISTEELLAPIMLVTKTATFGGAGLLIVGIISIFVFLQSPLRRIDEIVATMKRAMGGDLTVVADARTNDEIGNLAVIFNMMVDSVRTNQKELQKSKSVIEEKAIVLEKDAEEHRKQAKFLEESKLVTLNLLEDSWKAKELLSEEGVRLQTIIASIGDGLVIIDLEYKIVMVNAKALEIFNMTTDALLGKDLHDTMKLYKNKIYVEAGKWPTEEVLMTKKTFTSTIEDNFGITTISREVEVPVSFSVAPLSGRFTGAVLVFRDATKDRELDEAKSGFISVASHQLRTPLTSIRWYSEMLLSEDAGPLNDSQKDFMNEIHGGTQRLYQTVDLLLGISRVESGKLKTDRTKIDLSLFTDEIAKELRSQLDEKGLVLSVVPPEGDAVSVWLDSLTLRQVILNLFSNAIRYTNEKGTVEVKWWMNDDVRGEVVYMVHDNGIGIPESQKQRIFSKFFRAENARAQVPDGSGLGLALVKDLVEAWGGKVWFESSPGQGTTFFFTVPLTTEVTNPDLKK